MPSKKRRGGRGKAAPYFTYQLATRTLVGVANSIVGCLKELTELVMNSGCQPHPRPQADPSDIQNRPSPTQGPKPTPAERILFAAETWLTLLSEIEIQNTEPASTRGKGERGHRLMLPRLQLPRPDEGRGERGQQLAIRLVEQVL